MSDSKDKLLRDRVLEIDEQGRGLTSWEVEFIGRLVDQNVRKFSDKQAETINRIWRDRVVNGDEDDDL